MQSVGGWEAGPNREAELPTRTTRTVLDRPISFLATPEPDRSRDFFEQRVGLPFVADEPLALVFRAGVAAPHPE